MKFNHTLKTYLHSLLLITTFAASLAQYFVFHPQSHGYTIRQEIATEEIKSDAYQGAISTTHEADFLHKAPYLLLILLLIGAAIALRKFWQSQGKAMHSLSPQGSHPPTLQHNSQRF